MEPLGCGMGSERSNQQFVTPKESTGDDPE
jgi:hypothetical protein